MRSLAESGNAKTLVLPAATPGGYNELFNQMTAALMTAQSSQESMDPRDGRKGAQTESGTEAPVL